MIHCLPANVSRQLISAVQSSLRLMLSLKNPAEAGFLLL